MDFRGTGKKLSIFEIEAAARSVDIPLAAVRALIEVEAASYGFDEKDRPRILFEPHVFYRELAGRNRQTAVERGLAYPRWGQEPYPRTNDAKYEQLTRARAIHAEKAHRSASVGLGQTMGFNHQLCGYPTAIAMFEAYKTGEAEQLRGMLNFVVSNGIDIKIRAAIRQGGTPTAFRPVAAGYNGAAYATHNYHGRLSAAFLKFDRGTDAAARIYDPGKFESYDPREMPLLVFGTKDVGPGGPRALAQVRLQAYGYYQDQSIDGDFGPGTKEAVGRLQRDHPETGVVDHKIGKNTWAILLSAVDEDDPPFEDTTPAPPGSRPEPPEPIDPGKTGIGLVLAGALTYLWKIGLALLIVAALATAFYFAFRHRLEWVDRAGDRVIDFAKKIFRRFRR